MSDINLPFTCKQGWYILLGVAYTLCLIIIFYNYSNLIAYVPIGIVGLVHGEIALLSYSDKNNWSWPRIRCRCNK